MRRAGNFDLNIIRSTGNAKSTVYRVVAPFDTEGKVRHDTVPQWSKENQNILCWAEKDVEVRPNPVDVKTGTKAQRES